MKKSCKVLHELKDLAASEMFQITTQLFDL